MLPASFLAACGVSADSCTCGLEFATRFFQLRLFATVAGAGWLLSSNIILPMPGALGPAVWPGRDRLWSRFEPGHAAKLRTRPSAPFWLTKTLKML